MSGFSDYLENEILDWVKGTNMPAAPAAVYCALFDGDPGDDGAGGTELTNTLTGALNREPITLGAITDNGTGKQITNSAPVVITASAAAGATANHVAIFDADTAGNLLFSGALTAAKTIGIGDAVQFDATTLFIRIDV